jgi:hypothetical protein
MKHRIERSQWRRLAVGAIAVGAVAAATVGGMAAFAGTNDPTYSSLQGVHACISTDGKSRLYNGAIYRNTAHPTCPAGYARLDWATNAQGPAGQDATLTVSATTTISAWPENSGWAVDAFNRTLTVTRQHAADAAKCGNTQHCWFYTAQVADGGTFATVDGKPGPNGTGTVSGVNHGTITGNAVYQFYASGDTPKASTVPTSATGSAKPATTSTWPSLVFGADVTIAGMQLTGYDWEYDVSATCEHWSDKVNPGDDGQSAADGNIVGVSGCH